MRLTTCRLPSWYDPHCQSGEYRVSAAIRLFLCTARMYEIALAIKGGARLSHVSIFEEGIMYILHEDMSRLPDFSLQYDAFDGCQICSISNAIRMLARSNFAMETTDFIRATANGSAENLIARANYDWSEAFRRYSIHAGLARNSRGQRRMRRAEIIAGILRESMGDDVTLQQITVAQRLTKDYFATSRADRLVFPSGALSYPQNHKMGQPDFRVMKESILRLEDTNDRFDGLNGFDKQIDAILGRSLKIVNPSTNQYD